MHPLSFPWDATSPVKVLCLGAHSDDIEIGCGGTILRLVRQYPNCVFHWAVFSTPGVRAEEAQRGAVLFAGARALKRPLLKGFQDGFMPFAGEEVKTVFEELKIISPDLIFTHNRNDVLHHTTLHSELLEHLFSCHISARSCKHHFPSLRGGFEHECLTHYRIRV